MTHPDYNSPTELKAFLEQHDMAMQKKFGQNFMLNGDARKKIASLLELSENDKLWEIGPGLGCMTEEFLKAGAEVCAFEIDRGFIFCLKEFFSDYAHKGKFKIIEGDVLKNWKKELEQSYGNHCFPPIKLCGNLPYNIAATFIADTITAGFTFEKCVFTVQKEVAQRMFAKPSTENYSSFSVLCQWLYNVKPSVELGPGNFWPKPNVASQAVVLEKKKEEAECNGKTFVKTVHSLFSQRRKTLANNIKPVLPPSVTADEFFEKAGIAKNERAENLTVQDFIVLSRTFEFFAKK